MVCHACNKSSQLLDFPGDSLSNATATGNLQLAFLGSTFGLKIQNAEGIQLTGFITIEDNKGKVIRDRIRLDFEYHSDKYYSNTIELATGIYSLTEFIVIDPNGDLSYIIPKKTSEYAKKVKNPLPIFGLQVEEHQTLIIIPEVLDTRTNEVTYQNPTPNSPATENETARPSSNIIEPPPTSNIIPTSNSIPTTNPISLTEYGYETLQFNIIKLMTISIIAMDQVTPVTASITIQHDTKILYTGTLKAKTNVIEMIRLTDDQIYTVKIEKPGYALIEKSYLVQNLLRFHDKEPLMIPMLKSQ